MSLMVIGTGFGRTGNTWGCQTYDFMPDAIISSKNLTAGLFPMGAVILGPDLTDRLQRAIDRIEEFPHGFTASGHPVGCAIALKAIDVVMNEGLADNVKRLAPRLESGLRPQPLGPTLRAFLFGIVAVVAIQLLAVGSAYQWMNCSAFADITGAVLIGLAP